MVGWQRSVGVNLTDGYATFVEVERVLGHVRVVQSGRAALDAAEGADLARLPVRTGVHHVVVGLPRHKVVVRFIELPNVDEDRLAAVVSYEIERHLPFPVEEACYSFQKLAGSGSTAQVLIVAARRTDVELAIAMVERLGLTPTAVDVGTLAATHALSFEKHSGVDSGVVLIQMDGSGATVDVLHNRVLTSSRTVSVAESQSGSAPVGSGLSQHSRGAVSAYARSNSRLAVEGYVTFSGDGVQGKGTITNLSGYGWHVISDQPVTVGTSLLLQASLTVLRDPVEVTAARVQWTRPGEFGLKTVDLSEESRRCLRQVLDQPVWPDTPSTHAQPDTTALLSEVRRVMDASGSPPKRMLLHGGMQEMVRSLEEGLGASVASWDTTSLRGDPAAFGLALRGLTNKTYPIDLLPVERRRTRPDRTVAVLCSLMGAIALLGIVWWGSGAWVERQLLGQIDAELDVVKREAMSVASLKAEYGSLRTRLEFLEGLTFQQGRSLSLLKEMARLLPPDISLQEFSFEGDKLRLRGSTSTSAASLIASFEQSGMLENAAFTSPISVQGKGRQVFELAATIGKHPAPISPAATPREPS